MMTAHQAWKRHYLEAIKLSVDVYQEWPLLDLQINEDKGIYQPIANTSGVVFVRYGNNANLDGYISQLGDTLTTARVLHDEPLTFSSKPARRVQVILVTPQHEVYRTDSTHNIAHEPVLETRTLISVIGFRNRAIPVLVGYRLPEEELRVYQPLLEHIINSVTIS